MLNTLFLPRGHRSERPARAGCAGPADREAQAAHL